MLGKVKLTSMCVLGLALVGCSKNVGLAPLLRFLPGQTRTVNCDDGKSLIQKMLDKSKPGDTVVVRGGVCIENIIIRVPGLTLTAEEPGDGIAGATSATSTILVLTRQFTVRGLTITGGSNGVTVRDGGSAIVESNYISGAVSNGVFATGNSNVRVGGNSAAQGNRIYDTPRAVNVRNGSSGGVFFNNLTGDGNPSVGNIDDRGVDVNSNGAVDMSDNTITGFDRGVSLFSGGNVSLSSSRGPNTFTENVTAIRCRLGGSISAGVLPVDQIDGGGNGVLRDLNNSSTTFSPFRCHGINMPFNTDP